MFQKHTDWTRWLFLHTLTRDMDESVLSCTVRGLARAVPRTQHCTQPSIAFRSSERDMVFQRPVSFCQAPCTRLASPSYVKLGCIVRALCY